MAISPPQNHSAPVSPVYAPASSFNLFGDRSQLEDPAPSQFEMAVLIVVGTIGMIANFAIIVAILILANLRRASNAFLAHHCLLDFIKAGYCLPFAQTMVTDQPPLFCSLLGGSYIVFVTTSAFNLLAVVMNEAYLFSDLTLGVKDSRNYCCVIFGVFIIWFSSIIMNLGVAFIPGNPSFDRKIGHCIFVYGITRNYVLHMLWIVLISMGVGLTCMYLHKFRLDIKRVSYFRLTTLIRATVNIDPKVITSGQRVAHEIREKQHVEFLQRITHRKLFLLIMVVGLFILFWYPLFMLTTVDPMFRASMPVYKALTLFAWCNPSVCPFVLMFFIKQACCCKEHEEDLAEFDDNLDALEASRASIIAEVHRSNTAGSRGLNSRGESIEEGGEVSEEGETEPSAPPAPTTSNGRRRLSIDEGEVPRCSISGPILKSQKSQEEDEGDRPATRSLLRNEEYTSKWM